MQTLLAVLDKILWVLLVWKRSVDEKKAQESRDELEANPAGWFSKHFSGRVSEQSSQSTNSDQTNAGDPSKT